MSHLEYIGKQKIARVKTKVEDSRWEYPIMQGFMTKCGGGIKSWKRRWMILTREGKLWYFKNEKDKNPIKKKPVVVRGMEFCRAREKKKKSQFCLKLMLPNRIFFMFADNQKDYADWLEMLYYSGAKYKHPSFVSNVWMLPNWFYPFPIIKCMNQVQKKLAVYVFNKGGNKVKIEKLKNLLNLQEKVDFAEYDVYTLCDLIKAYFRAHVEAMFAPLYSQLIKIGQNKKSEERVEELSNKIIPELRKRRIPYELANNLFSLFHKVHENFEKTKMDSAQLSKTFFQYLCRPKGEKDVPYLHMQPTNTVICCLIENYKEIFAVKEKKEEVVTKETVDDSVVKNKIKERREKRGKGEKKVEKKVEEVDEDDAPDDDDDSDDEAPEMSDSD